MKKSKGLDAPHYIKCTICGRFVSFRDIASGKAVYRLEPPDSEFSDETAVAVCKTCNGRE